MSRQTRNYGIDLFRCLLVYGICAYHAFCCCGHANGSESRLWTWAVPGFGFVSGYFGVSFKYKKLVRLLLTGCACAVLPCLISGGDWAEYKRALFGYWYLWAYMLLMILSPLINLGLSAMRQSHDYRSLWGVGALAIWSWLSECFLTRQYVPHVAGMGALSFVSVFVAYVLGWLCREFPERVNKIRPWWLLILLPLSAVLVHYTSPVTLLIVVALFAWFKRLHVPHGLGVVATKIGAAGFAVYLLHANWPVLAWMQQKIEWLLSYGVPRYWSLMGTAFVVFVIGVLVYWTVGLPLSFCKRRFFK